MDYTGYTVLKTPKSGAAFAYAKEAREFATGATGAGGYLNSAATTSGWTDVHFVSAITEGSSPLPVSIGATYTHIYTGAATVIGGATPIGDLRSEDSPYVGVGTNSVYYTKKGQEYGAAFYATYIGGTKSLPTKIGIGTSAGDIATSGYYEGGFTTRSIYEFETSFTPDLDDLTKITTGSGVYKDGADVSLQFNILNRNGELLTSASQIAADPFVEKQIISILDSDSNVAFPSYRTNGDSTFTFSRSQNIDVFGSYNRNFGIRNEIVNADGGISTGEFYLYANTATFDKVIVQSSGETSLNENLTNHSPPDTGSITSAADRADAIKYFNNQPINTSGSTGFIELTLGFNESPNFTNLGDLTIWKGTSGDFTTNRGNLVSNYPLNSIQEGQRIRITANDGIEEATPLFFKLAADSEVAFESELLTIGPYTLEPNVEGPDLNLYNQGDQSLIGDFTIQGGLEGDDANGGNLNVSGNALGTGDGGRLTGPEGKPYLLTGDAGTESDTLQTVTARGNTVTGLDVDFNDATLYIGHTDQRVGIGTNYPRKQLEVVGDSLFEGSIISTGPYISGVTGLFSDHVGIGTTSSSDKTLYVEGTAEFTKKIGQQLVNKTQINTDGYSINTEQKCMIATRGSQVNSIASAILGGSGNIVSGDYDVIAGGAKNNISGCDFSFIGGGSGIDIIESEYSSSIGGYNNDISGSNHSVIGGGLNNSIEGSFSNYIGGGENNLITGANSFIGGGNVNKALARYSFIGGGESNITSGEFSIIIGGENNKTFGSYSIVAGGEGNIASGLRSFVGGGLSNEANSEFSYAFGRRAKITESHSGAALFTDGNNSDALSSGAHTATLKFQNGVYVQTDSGLYVNGNPVMTGINPYDEDTLQSVTNRGATSTNAISVTNTITANQVLGTGIGNRITNNNVPYLLSGDSPAETQTLQDVTDNGSTTTRAITVGAFSATGTANISGILSIPNGRAVASNDVYYIVKLTQAEYDAITPDASTMYIITDEDFNSPVINPIKTVVSNYTITDTDYTILVSGSSTVNIALPSAAINSNYVYNIKNITTNSVVVAPSAGHIDGNTSKTINQKFESIATQSDGSNWYII